MKHTGYLTILTDKEKQKIEKKLQTQFGIKKIPGILIKKGAERIFLYQGNFSPKEIINLEQEVPIERVGVYFAKKMGEEIRLSIEGTQMLADQITKNIFELNKEQMIEWMHGNELRFEEINKEKIKINKKGFALNERGEAEPSRDSIWVGGTAKPELQTLKGFLIMKYRDNFLGTGKASAEKISNFIPKNRRLRERS